MCKCGSAWNARRATLTRCNRYLHSIRDPAAASDGRGADLGAGNAKNADAVNCAARARRASQTLLTMLRHLLVLRWSPGAQLGVRQFSEFLPSRRDELCRPSPLTASNASMNVSTPSGTGLEAGRAARCEAAFGNLSSIVPKLALPIARRPADAIVYQ